MINRKVVLVYGVLSAAVGALLYLLASVAPMQAQDPVEYLQVKVDSIWTEIHDTKPEWHRRPVWMTRDLRPMTISDDEAEAILNDAAACVLHAGEEVEIPENVEWWSYSSLVFVDPTGYTSNYLGLTLRYEDKTVIMVVDDDHYEGTTMQHEAAHAVCVGNCSHDRTDVAERCEREVP